jgi:hypothetical protein
MLINSIYKVQFLSKKTGFWEVLNNFPEGEYSQAVTSLYNHYKFDNSRQYRLVQVKEELMDFLSPPGS